MISFYSDLPPRAFMPLLLEKVVTLNSIFSNATLIRTQLQNSKPSYEARALVELHLASEQICASRNNKDISTLI